MENQTRWMEMAGMMACPTEDGRKRRQEISFVVVCLNRDAPEGWDNLVNHQEHVVYEFAFWRWLNMKNNINSRYRFYETKNSNKKNRPTDHFMHDNQLSETHQI
jgi:hypothetical protein